MLTSVKIENFRCFKKFELQKLGRLNLLVGTNNSGKTSILEAIYLLRSKYNIEALKEIMMTRGEYIEDKNSVSKDLDIRHIFFDHQLSKETQLSVLAVNSGDEEIQKTEALTINISIKPNENTTPFAEMKDPANLTLVLQWLDHEYSNISFPLSADEYLFSEQLELAARRLRFHKDIENSDISAQFISVSSLTTKNSLELFDQIVLTPEEELVTQALQIIEPDIERIASVASKGYGSGDSRGAFLVKLFNSQQRIPIGSMGDGVWRIFAIALVMVRSKNGIVLIDEIDTGFHFSTMSAMWKMIWETAKRLNVQVFATTHSSDCWKSLAEIVSTERPSKAGITIHRIEKDKSSSVLFTERQIAIAAEREIEVR